MLRPVSVGAKWALRYALVTFVTISLLGLYAYERAEGRVERDAELIADIPMRNLLEVARRHPGNLERVAEAVERELAAAEDDLRLGVQVFDEEGNLLLARGSLEGTDLPLGASVAAGERSWDRWDTERPPGSHPYQVVTARAPGFYFQTAIYTRRFDRHLDFIADGLLLALPVTLVVTAVLGWLLARGSLRPIQRITDTARRISGAHLDEEVPTTGSGDELDRLAVTLNEMMARIRDSVERIRRFSADAAHELRTPLAAIRSQVEVTLERPRSPAEYDRVLRQVLEEVDRLAEGTDALLRLSRSEAGLDPARREAVDLEPLLRELVEFFEPLAGEKDVKLALGAEAAPPVVGDPAWLHQLFANLVHNAIKFTPAGGSVDVGLAPGAKGRTVSVAVRDTGVGIPPDQTQRIFERFHKVDAARSASGFGLGLSLAHEIARIHDGRIEVESEPGRGSEFRVELPAASPAP